MPGTKTTWKELLGNRNEGSCSSGTVLQMFNLPGSMLTLVDGEGCFRPVGLVFNPTGENLYVSSDTTGEVFMLKRNAGPVADPGGSTTVGPTTAPTPTTPTTTVTVPTPTTSNPAGPAQTMYGQW